MRIGDKHGILGMHLEFLCGILDILRDVSLYFINVLLSLCSRLRHIKFYGPGIRIAEVRNERGELEG